MTMSDSELPAPLDIVVSPEPTEDELAAIVAAYRELWPRQIQVVRPEFSERWKFSGRWWLDLPGRKRG